MAVGLRATSKDSLPGGFPRRKAGARLPHCCTGWRLGRLGNGGVSCPARASNFARCPPVGPAGPAHSTRRRVRALCGNPKEKGRPELAPRRPVAVGTSRAHCPETLFPSLDLRCCGLCVPVVARLNDESYRIRVPGSRHSCCRSTACTLGRDGVPPGSRRCPAGIPASIGSSSAGFGFDIGCFPGPFSVEGPLSKWLV